MIPSQSPHCFAAVLGHRMPKPGYKAYFSNTGEEGFVTWVGEAPDGCVEIEVSWDDGTVNRYGYYEGLLFEEA